MQTDDDEPKNAELHRRAWTSVRGGVRV